MKFKIPRKIKKKLKKFIFLYPEDSDGNSQMAFPHENQEDYNAYKNGILETPFNYTKKETKERSIKWEETYLKPCEMTTDELLSAINTVFREEYVKEAEYVLMKAKKHPTAIEDYYTFCNAYKLNKYNIACMSIDGAKESFKNKK